jgi:hypothetical protein
MEKSHESFTHKACGYLFDFIKRSKKQSARPILLPRGNENGIGFAER